MKKIFSISILFILISTSLSTYATGYYYYGWTGNVKPCPGITYEYYPNLYYFDYTHNSAVEVGFGSCDSWSVTNATIVDGGGIHGFVKLKTNDDTLVTIKCHIKYYGNSYQSGNFDDYVTLQIHPYSLKGITASPISGSNSIYSYDVNDKTYSINTIKYLNGDNIDSYSWVIPSGWKYNGIISNGSNRFVTSSPSITVTPDNCSSGTISVYGINKYGGANSNSSSLAISRTLNPATVISGSSTVCSSGNNFSITNLPPVSSIVWTCGPNLSISSGQNTSTCTVSATGIVNSWIKATLVTTCGTTFTLPQKDVTGGLRASFTGNTSIDYRGSGTWTASASGCPGPYHFRWWLREETNPPVGAILVGEDPTLMLWSWPRSSMTAKAEQGMSVPTIIQPSTSTRYYLSLCVFDDNRMRFDTQEQLIIAYGDVDLIDPRARMASQEAGESTSIQMKISPNPTTDEATVELCAAEDKGLECSEWQLEIYDATQVLKTKIQKIKGNKQSIRTAAWKEGVYIVRAKAGNKVLTNKLVIKP